MATSSRHRKASAIYAGGGSPPGLIQHNRVWLTGGWRRDRRRIGRQRGRGLAICGAWADAPRVLRPPSYPWSATTTSPVSMKRPSSRLLIVIGGGVTGATVAARKPGGHGCRWRPDRRGGHAFSDAGRTEFWCERATRWRPLPIPGFLAMSLAVSHSRIVLQGAGVHHTRVEGNLVGISKDLTDRARSRRGRHPDHRGVTSQHDRLLP